MDKKERFVIFYYLHGDYSRVYVNAEDLSDALACANSFATKSSATILGVFPEYLYSLKVFKHE